MHSQNWLHGCKCSAMDLDAFERAVAKGAFVAPRQRGRTLAAVSAASASACSSPSAASATAVRSTSSWLLSSAMRDSCEQQIWAAGHRLHTAPCSPSRVPTAATASSTSSFAPSGAWLHAFRQRLAHISSYQRPIATPINRIPRPSAPASATTPTRTRSLHRLLLSSLLMRLRSTNTLNKV